VRVEDLLHREAVSLEEHDLVEFLGGKVVMVTGAGGAAGRLTGAAAGRPATSDPHRGLSGFSRDAARIRPSLSIRWRSLPLKEGPWRLPRR